MCGLERGVFQALDGSNRRKVCRFLEFFAGLFQIFLEQMQISHRHVRGGRFRIGSERLPECVVRCRQVALVERQIRRSEVERDVVLFGKFLELFLGGLNVFFASRRFSQSDNGIAIVRGLLEDFERFFFCVGKVSDGHITTGEPYSILIVLRVQLACLLPEMQRRARVLRRPATLLRFFRMRARFAGSSRSTLR